MKIPILGWLHRNPKARWLSINAAAITALLACLCGEALAQPATVTTLTDANHGKPGYKNGSTFYAAQFRYPAAICLDPSGKSMFMADCSNNAVRLITYVGDNANSYTYSAYTNNDGINRPIDIAVDSNTNVYVLNRGGGKDGTVLKFNGSYLINYGVKQLITTNASKLTNASALTLDTSANIYIAIKSNTVVRAGPGGSNTIVGVITNAGTSLRGMTFRTDGKLALTDAGNNGVWLMDVTSTNIYSNSTKLTGFNGAGDVLGPLAFSKFNSPEKIARAGNGYLVVADNKNHKVKIVDVSGNVTRLYGVSSTYWGSSYPGWADGTVNVNESVDPVEARLPLAVTVAKDGTVYATENYYSLLRQATGTGLPALPPPPPPAPTIWSVVTNYGQVALTWSSVDGATSYHVKRSSNSGGPYTTIANASQTTYTDTTVVGGNTYYYVVSAINDGGEGANSDEVMAFVPLPPVPDPEIGYVLFPPYDYLSVFYPVSASGIVLNNDAYIVIKGTYGSQTFYTYGNTPQTTNDPAIPNPTSSSASAPAGYTDGLSQSTVAGTYAIAQVMPDLTIKAIGKSQAGNPDSSIVTARFQYIVANPVINGANAAAFTLSDITQGAHLYYTVDGSDPSPNNGVDIGTVASVTNTWNLSLAISSNTLFKVRGFRANYQPSSIVSNMFTVAGFKPNTITFGRSSGEPYSKFIARPGQSYWAPVTLNLVPGFTKMYSLQFNVGVTNGYTNIVSGAAVPPVTVNNTNAGFFSMLMTSVDPIDGQYFPPADGSWYLNIPPVLIYFDTSGTNYVPSTFVNSANNLLGVAWMFRTGFKYRFTDTNNVPFLVFDTASQDLITYSIVHDTLFRKADGLVVVGAYSFQVPNTATNGDQYFIQLGSPSATSDGVGAPGADIFIAPPTSSQAVTVGSPSYLVGDTAPFHWLNAGDFGEGELDSADVMQTYQAAIVNVNLPPVSSDLYAAMDSSGGYGTWDTANNYYTNSGTISSVQQQSMWDGNDLSINTNAFGDGVLDINDLYVTFRRSLDPSLTWFKRYWTNGQFVAVTAPNLAFNSNSPSATMAMTMSARSIASAESISYKDSFVTFTTGDAVVSSGQSVQIPIYAQVKGSYSLKVLGLSLSVVPLDGSPSLTDAVTFTPAAGLGSPTLPSFPKGLGDFSGAWLNAGIAGLTGKALVGTLTVKIPASATSSSAYAIHFNHASGSPNGLAIFPKQAITGLITLSSRTNSSYGDGIPDSWRLRWFGTVNNYLSVSNACPSGDGIANWMKYVAGVDPNVANNFPSVSTKSAPSGYTAAIQWPTVAGKQYVIERSTTLFPGDWSTIATNTGTGGDMQFNDNKTGTSFFYRVRILP